MGWKENVSWIQHYVGSDMRKLLALLGGLAVVCLAVATIAYITVGQKRRTAVGFITQTNGILQKYETIRMSEDSVSGLLQAEELPGVVPGRTLVITWKDHRELRAFMDGARNDISKLQVQLNKLIPHMSREDKGALIIAVLLLTDLECRLARSDWPPGSKDYPSYERDWRRVRAKIDSYRTVLATGAHSKWSFDLSKELEWYLTDRELAARRSGEALCGKGWPWKGEANTPTLPDSAACFLDLVSAAVGALGERSSYLRKGPPADKHPPADIRPSDIYILEQLHARNGMSALFNIGILSPKSLGKSGMLTWLVLFDGGWFPKLRMGAIHLKWVPAVPLKVNASGDPGRHK